MKYTDWPTLGSMIDNGTRLVTFMDAGASFSEVPYIIDGMSYATSSQTKAHKPHWIEFTNMWETAYDVTDPTFDCNVNRTKGDSSTQLYTINHFLDTSVTSLFDSLTPDKNALNQTNAANGTGSLGLQAEQCGTQYGRSPNFMLVDVSFLPLKFPSACL